MKKSKKKVSKKKVLPKKELVLEEHIVKMIEELEKKPKDTIEAVVKKAKPKEKEAKKTKKTKKGKNAVYGRGKDSEYRGLEGAGIYSQVTINPFVGFVYKRNVKENDDLYQHLASSKAVDKTRDLLGEKNLASSEMMEEYALKVTLNFLTGVSPLFGLGGGVSMEEKDQMKFTLYDRAQNVIYEATRALLGFGYNNTVLKTTDFNRMGTTDKAA